MLKIFPTIQIKELDAYTIENEPIASIDLMERASQALAKAISERWGAETPFTVFAGPGNNGGDALAVSRLQNAIKEAEEFGLLGDNILGTDFCFHMHINLSLIHI